MATDYDAPRRNEADEMAEDSLDELKQRRNEAQSAVVDVEETDTAESYELPGADLSGEELTVEQALHCCTYESAYGVHEENVKGRLIPGQLADVAVFDTDFFEMDAPERILDAQCVLTIRGGETVFERAA